MSAVAAAQHLTGLSVPAGSSVAVAPAVSVAACYWSKHSIVTSVNLNHGTAYRNIRYGQGSKEARIIYTEKHHNTKPSQPPLEASLAWAVPAEE